jgi:hypothetical protein
MNCRQPSTSSQEPLAQLVFEATGNLHLGRVRVPAILSAGYLCTVELVPCNSSWKRAHIHRVSIAALSSSQLSPETARHYISLRWRPPPALRFPSSLSPLVQRTPNELSRASCLRTVFYRASDRQWPDLGLEHITSAPPLPSTVLASAGKNPEQAHRAQRSEDIASRLSLPASASDHNPTVAPRSCLFSLSSDVRIPVKRPLQNYLIISIRFRDTLTAALCRLFRTL